MVSNGSKHRSDTSGFLGFFVIGIQSFFVYN